MRGFFQKRPVAIVGALIVVLLIPVLYIQHYKSKKAIKRAYYSGMYDAECPSQAEHERKLKEGVEAVLEDACKKGFKECDWECFGSDDRYSCKKACEAGLKECTNY